MRSRSALFLSLVQFYVILGKVQNWQQQNYFARFVGFTGIYWGIESSNTTRKLFRNFLNTVKFLFEPYFKLQVLFLDLLDVLKRLISTVEGLLSSHTPPAHKSSHFHHKMRIFFQVKFFYWKSTESPSFFGYSASFSPKSHLWVLLFLFYPLTSIIQTTALRTQMCPLNGIPPPGPFPN